jgi:hypothetical protein
MSVKLIEDIKCYSVKKDGEWATICIRPTKNEQYNGGEILIHSSFGSWGYFWGNVGERGIFNFLCGVDYSYLFSKLDSDLGFCFDCDGTIREIKRTILKDRRMDDISAEEARDHYDKILSFEEWLSPHEEGDLFYGDLYDSYKDLYNHLTRNDVPIITKKKPSCEWFWKIIWSEFIAELKKQNA